jgi:hypothetical protein
MLDKRKSWLEFAKLNALKRGWRCVGPLSITSLDFTVTIEPKASVTDYLAQRLQRIIGAGF